MDFLTEIGQGEDDLKVNLSAIAVECETLYRQYNEVESMKVAVDNLERLESVGFYTEEQRSFVTECITDPLQAPDDYIITTEGLVKSIKRGGRAIVKGIFKILRKIRSAIIYVLHGFKKPKWKKAKGRRRIRRIEKSINKLKIAKYDPKMYKTGDLNKRMNEIKASQTKVKTFTKRVVLYRATLDKRNNRVNRPYVRVAADKLHQNVSMMAKGLHVCRSFTIDLERLIGKSGSSFNKVHQAAYNKLLVFISLDVIVLARHFKKSSQLLSERTDAVDRKKLRKMKKKDRKSLRKDRRDWNRNRY